MSNGSENFRMPEFWEKNYFIFIKFGYVLLTAVYNLLNSEKVYRNNAFLLAAAAVCAFVMTVYETTGRRSFRMLLLAAECACVMLGIHLCGEGFIVLLPVAVSDAVSLLNLHPYLFSVSLTGLLMINDKFSYLMLCLFTAVIYWQHFGVILKYRQYAENYEEEEMRLKNSIETSAEDFKNELRKTNLHYENLILQDKARITQALHDKLGHRINGSVYQLEACRAIASSNPEKADEILGRVTQSLRDGMDEIRTVLRSERPETRRIAMLELTLLCEKCKSQYGIDAQLTTEGDSSRISDKVWSVIYDNCCEAVTNAMKYARCSRMHIEIKVLNQMIRCCVSDNGQGCADIRDGMGLEGIKRRVAQLGGTAHISGDDGFRINMLIPIE